MTLMEVLVTLVLISLATMLMFQMLGSYRIARERIQSQSGTIDRQSLFTGWFRASVQGLFIDRGITFAGSATALDGTTLNPLYAAPTTPTAVRWELVSSAKGMEIVYSEAGRERWRQPLAHTRSATFGFLDEAGKRHDSWPPKLGKQDDLLPSVVLLLRENEGLGEPSLAAAVLGPLKPVPRLTGEEDI